MKKIKHTFRLTDLVRISKTLPVTMKHFDGAGEEAIVVGRQDEKDEYALHIKHHGRVAWYPAECLTFIKHDQSALLDKWEAGKYGKKKKVERKIPDELRNFTAILPVTCNADCSFCPEKEMENKAPQKEWQDNLIAAIKEHGHRVDHISISGGEPTLRMKFLFETIDRIRNEAGMRKVGMTSNGQFLEKPNQTLMFLDHNTDDMLESRLSHLNISMHSFDRDKANKIMGVKYNQSIDDLIRFRRQLGRKLSFHINFVITEQNIDNIEWEMRQAREVMTKCQHIDIVFRIDYNNEKLCRELRNYGLAFQEYKDNVRAKKRGAKLRVGNPPTEPELVKLFDSIFDGSYYDDITEETVPGFGDYDTNACPSCFTHRSADMGSMQYAWLKASSFEPNADEEEYTEMVFHMDGKLYFDWSRNEPVPASKPKTKKAKRFDFEQKSKHDEPNGAARKLEQSKKAKPTKVKKAKKAATHTGSSSCNYSSPCSYSRSSSCSFGSGMC